MDLDELKNKDFTYDQWLEYFRHVPMNELVASQSMLKSLPTEAYVAAARWIEIISKPSKMDKLYQGRLQAEQDANIMDVAVGDDDEAFYLALIMKNVAQLDTTNISQQEVARLTQNINIFRKELRDIRSRKPKKGTVLEKVLDRANKPSKPARKRSKKITVKKKNAK